MSKLSTEHTAREEWLATPSIPDTAVDTELDNILLTFERNAVDAWKDNKSDVALVRKLRPNRTTATKAIKQLLTTEINRARKDEQERTQLHVYEDGTRAIRFLHPTGQYQQQDIRLAELESRLKHLGSLLEGEDNV